MWVLMHYADPLAQFHFSMNEETLTESCVLIVYWNVVQQSVCAVTPGSGQSGLAILLEPNHKNATRVSSDASCV